MVEQKDYSEVGYKRLAAAIIKQAVKDYESGRNKMKSNNKSGLRYKQGLDMVESTKRFFYSESFQILTEKVDGPALFKQIEENYDNYGRCMLTEGVDV